MQNRKTRNNLLVIASFLAIYLIWGSTFLAIAIALKSYPPFLLASLRFLIAGLLLFVYCLFKNYALPDKPTVIKNICLGMLLFVCGQGSLIWSEQYLSSGNAAILFATLPIWFVIFDRPNWNSYFKSANLIFGITIGFAGIILLFFDKSEAAVPSSSGSIEIIACFVILFGIICWVTASLYYRSHLSSGSVFLNLSIQLISASIICLVISFSFREFAGFAIIDISFAPTVAVLYLAIAGSIIAFAAYSWLLTQRTPVSVGTFAYINPLIAVFLGWLLANEKITMLQQFAMLNVAGSAFLINKNKKSG